MTRTAPSTGSAIATLTGVTLLRLVRGKALWFGATFAAVPVAFTAVMRVLGVAPFLDDIFVVWRLLGALLAAMLVGSSIGEEVEDKTGTYLWSRPIARWAVLAGKLGALAPVVVALGLVSWCAATVAWTRTAPAAASCASLLASSAAACAVAAGIACLVPRHALALTIGYLLVDDFAGALPFSVRQLTIANHAGAIAERSGTATATVAILAIAGVWLAIGAWRIRRLEI